MTTRRHWRLTNSLAGKAVLPSSRWACSAQKSVTQMVDTAFTPAFAKDLSNYKDVHALVGDRAKLYSTIKAENDKLKGMLASKPHELAAEAEYLCDKVKPQMGV